MDPLLAVIYSRAVERLFVVLIGGGCIYLGWRLFIDVTVDNSKGEMVARLPKFNLTLKRIGPGVMFAAFGAAVVATSFFFPISFERTISHVPKELIPARLKKAADQDDKTVEQVSFNGATAGNEKEIERKIVILNQLLQLIDTDDQHKAQLQPRLNDLRRQRARVESLRDDLIKAAFKIDGVDFIALWKQSGQTFLTNPGELSDDQRQKLTDIQRLFLPDPIGE